jgi:carbamoyltransferase
MSPASPRHVVGIHHSGPIATAAIVRDGRVLAAAPEERFSRSKHDRSFPHRAIAYCLQEADIEIGDVDAFAIGWNPGENVAMKYRSGHSDWMRYPGEWLGSVPNHLLSRTGDRIRHTVQEFESIGGRTHRMEFVDHHMCHARFATATSGFDACAVLVADGWSEQKVTSAYVARGTDLELIRSIEFPHSIGCFYAAMTEHLGYSPFSDEWKVMGMAAYGDPSRCPEIETLIELLPDGRYEMELSYFDYYFFERAGFCGPKMAELLGPRRERGAPLEQRHFDIAAAAQQAFERVMTHVLAWLHETTGQTRLALTGGVAMNCLYNGRVAGLTGFDDVAVCFAPDDSGNSIGAAMEAAHRMGDDVRAPGLTSALGPAFDDDAIERSLQAYKLRHRRLDDVVATAADLIAEGKIVGWFQGRGEFGQRALGHRSILASPAFADMKDRINAAVKYRESYRPFAPVVALEDLATVFETPEGTPVRYMEKALPVRPEWHDRIPAVVHADGTGRLQTVNAAEEPLFHALLRACTERTGVPCLLNTSFNLNGEPVVSSPEDALRTFVTCGMDALVLGSFLIEKD